MTDIDELERELAWFGTVVDLRFRSYFAMEGGTPAAPVGDVPPPDLDGSTSYWASLVRSQAPTHVERLALVLGLMPHLCPRLLDPFFAKNVTFQRRFTEFGGTLSDDEFLPTGETLAFLLDGGSMASRMAVAHLLDPEHPLNRTGVLRATPQGSGQSFMKAPLCVSAEVILMLTTGHQPRPTLGIDFPAHRLTTGLGWDDLVLHPATMEQVRELQTWILHHRALLDDWGMAARLRPGLRVLFYGPPGTGKTLSACLLGQLTDREVYRIDLSLVVSKYIGETEKNLARAFEWAEQRDWILFFDEADALFGKRGETKDAHDRYANQEVAYLLQRIETFDGVVILASNRRDDIDEAFARRFESMIYFPLPRAEERLRLWTSGFSSKARLEVDFAAVAREHELSGGAIMNVIRTVSLAAIAEGERAITQEDLARAIRRERAKVGRGGG